MYANFMHSKPHRLALFNRPKHTSRPSKDFESRKKDPVGHPINQTHDPTAVIQRMVAARVQNIDQETCAVLLGDLSLVSESLTPTTIATTSNISQHGNGYDGIGDAFYKNSYASSECQDYRGNPRLPPPPNDGEGNRREPRHSTCKQLQPSHPDVSRPQFACPFFKFHLGSHLRCALFQSGRISDVVQHIYRVHVHEFCCSNCHEVFDGIQDYNFHIRARNCTQNFYLHHGLLQGEYAFLHQHIRNSRGASHSPARWFVIWDYLFPGMHQPSSPYYNPDWMLEWYSHVLTIFTQEHAMQLMEDFNNGLLSLQHYPMDYHYMSEEVSWPVNIALGNNRLHYLMMVRIHRLAAYLFHNPPLPPAGTVRRQ